jgi:hypothetical protein
MLSNKCANRVPLATMATRCNVAQLSGSDRTTHHILNAPTARLLLALRGNKL